MNTGAEFSQDRKYRYALWRIWDESLPLVLYICLNSSIAEEVEDDNTIKKLKKVSRNNGFGGFYIANLFAIISSDPKILYTGTDLFRENDAWIHWLKITNKFEKVVFAWSNEKAAIVPGKEMMKVFKNPFCFKINKSGSPKHPLYCKDDSVLIPYVI